MDSPRLPGYLDIGRSQLSKVLRVDILNPTMATSMAVAVRQLHIKRHPEVDNRTHRLQ